MIKSRRIRVKDVANLINGHPFKKKDWDDNGLYKIIRIQNLNNRNADFNKTSKEVPEKYFVQQGDILISWSASLGVYKWEDEKSILNQHIYKVEFTSDDILEDYFKYIIRVALKELTFKMRGGGIKHLTKPMLDNYEFYLPSIDVQTQIISKLNLVQGLIVKRQETIELLDEYLKSIFLKMFPLDECKLYPLAKFIKKSNYGTSLKTSDENKGIPVLRMNNITCNGFINLANLKWLNIDITEENKDALILQPRDIIFNRTNSRELVGKTSIWNNTSTIFSFASYLIRIQLKEKSLNPYYLWAFLNSKLGKEILYERGQSSGSMVNISLTLLKTILIPIPNSIDKQNTFEEVYFRVIAQKELIKKSLDLLQNLFKSLEYRFFNTEQETSRVESLVKEQLKLEQLRDSLSISDYESVSVYNEEKNLLFEILEFTEKRKKEVSEKNDEYLDGLILKLDDNQNIVIKTNRDDKHEVN